MSRISIAWQRLPTWRQAAGRRPWRIALGLPLLVLTVILGPAAPASGAGHAMTPAVGHTPHYIYTGPATQATVFSCQANTAPVRCYGPNQIRQAYDIAPLLRGGVTGKGRTIVIVDAYQSPTILHDLQTFDGLFGLSDPTLNIIAPDGLTAFDPNDPNQVGWAGEISLDVEWAHAIAPDATIDLVLAKSNMDSDILSATRYAVTTNLGDVISQSFGEAEACAAATLAAEHQLFQQATVKRITLLASSGDQGVAQPTCDGTSYTRSASTPASDPLVTGVGGTQLDANARTGAYEGEIAWNEPLFGAASGGGYSTVYPRPLYQQGVVGTFAQARAVPDVAYSAAINGGVLTVWSTSGQGADLVFTFGGTSVGSPQWAGLVALGDQLANGRLGFLNGALYRLGRGLTMHRNYHDITFGNNTFTLPTGASISGYDTQPGWDAVTGWGTPRAATLVPALVGEVAATDAALSQ